MENTTNNNAISKKKILNLICLIIFSLAFIFACLKSVLPLGKWIVCTFGIVTYPLFLLLSLIELAKFLGLSYKRSIKSTVYVLISVVSLLFVIQAISTYKALDKVASFASLKTYLNYSYDVKITLVGGFGSIFVGLLAVLLGAMGSIIAFVIVFTISVGVIVDYENYGKYDENVKKLKTKKLREKVNESDKNAESGVPDYGFGGEVAGTIEVNENEINYNEQTNINVSSTYTNDDVVGEITDETYTNSQSQEITDFSSNPFGYQDEETLNQSRRDFMGGTFGGTYQQPEEPAGLSYEEPTNVKPAESYIDDISGFQTTQPTPSWEEEPEPTIKINDDIKDILSKEESDVESLAPEYWDEPPRPAFEPTAPKSPFDTQFGTFGGENTGFNQPEPPKPVPFIPQTSPYDEPINIEKRNEGIMTGIQPIKKPEPVSKPRIASVNQTSMAGVRYNAPPLSLLARPVKDNGDYSEEQTRKSKQLEQVLNAFNVPATVVNIVRGPKITRYELSVPYGVSVKKIPNYELDIQSALAAKTITIQAPIPGSNFVGIELENDVFTNVCERELLESPEFQNAKGPLPIAIGKDISGQIVVKSLSKMVHCLVAGSTGSGKSVFIHNIVLSLIYKYSPDDLRLVMVDPKRVEFGFYNGLPHLITPEVVLGTEKAVSALKWCVKEMDRRFEIMGRANYKNIEDYNKSELVKSGQFEHFPYIVIIVDELAEIMINYKKDAEPAIQRITQLARACGMHLIVAVQRPSVDIITGVIKNNISSRFAFRLQSSFDSKTMLGTNGAEKLLNRGDMLMQLTDTSAMPRLQGAYASDDEIKAVVDFIKRNNPANFDEEATKAINDEPQSSSDGGEMFANEPQSKGKVDEYFKIAVKSVMMAGSASVSYLQRRLSIGYSRAARIVDQMEEKGYIDPPTGAKQRKVLITPERFKEDFGEDYNS